MLLFFQFLSHVLSVFICFYRFWARSGRSTPSGRACPPPAHLTRQTFHCLDSQNRSPMLQISSRGRLSSRQIAQNHWTPLTLTINNKHISFKIYTKIRKQTVETITCKKTTKSRPSGRLSHSGIITCLGPPGAQRSLFRLSPRTA